MKVNDQWRLIASAESKNNPNLMLGENLSEIWSVSIGKGDSRKKRLVTDPVFFENRIFTLDANSIASAFDVNGKLLWRQDLTPPGEKSGEIFGGGLTLGQDQLFVQGFRTGVSKMQGRKFAGNGHPVVTMRVAAIP